MNTEITKIKELLKVYFEDCEDLGIEPREKSVLSYFKVNGVNNPEITLREYYKELK